VEADTLLISSASTPPSCGVRASNAKCLPEFGQRIDSHTGLWVLRYPGDTVTTMLSPALQAADEAGLRYRVIRHGAVRSLAEAAQARGVPPADVVKTLVIRRGDGDFLFVLVPGNRTISWPKLRALLDVSRLSLPDAGVARDATGYERGTITPFGSLQPWPVIVDARIAGREITLGAGQHGVAIAAAADDVIGVLGATIADISEPDSVRRSDHSEPEEAT